MTPAQIEAAFAAQHEQLVELRRENNFLRWSLKAIITAHPPFGVAVEKMLEANISNMLASDLPDEEVVRANAFLAKIRH